MISLKKAEFLRRYILVHSYIYYELDDNIITDKQYDQKSNELTELQKDVQNQAGMYWKVFGDYDGNTGFDLYHRLNEEEQCRISTIARFVLKESKR